MTREKEIEQLCAELAQLRTEDGAWDERCLYEFIKERNELRAKLAQAQIECNVLAKTFTDANELHATVRGELAQAREELADARRVALSYLRMATERQKELAQAQRRLAIPDQACGYCGYRYSAGTNEVNFAVLAEHIKSCPKHPLAKALVELTQTREELTDAHITQNVLRRNRDFWFETCLSTEKEYTQMRKEAQEQSALVQRDWLSPAEAEGLRRQLKHAEDAHTYRFKEYDALEIDLCHAAEGEAAIVEAAEVLVSRL